MNSANLKTVPFWADLLLTLGSLLLASGLVTSSSYVHAIGWIVSILGTMGFHSFLPAPAAADGTAK